MTLLSKAWSAWKRFGRKLGDAQARLLLTFAYFVIIAPFALAIRAADPLAIRRATGRGWRTRPPASPETVAAAARRQS